jgi:hypothetical protein
MPGMSKNGEVQRKSCCRKPLQKGHSGAETGLHLGHYDILPG